MGSDGDGRLGKKELEHFATLESADRYLEEFGGGLWIEQAEVPAVHETYEDFLAGRERTARERALAKLTDEDKRALGLA